MKNGMQFWNMFCLALSGGLLVFLALSLAVRTMAQNDGADLVLRKMVNQERVSPGSDTTYTLWVENRGPRPATNVQLSDVLPEEAIFVRVEGTLQQECSYVQQTHTILCRHPILGVGKALPPLTIVVQAPISSHVELFNTALVTSESRDPRRDDNSAMFRTLVQSVE